MSKQELYEVLGKLVQREVAKQVSLMKTQIISEVTGMLQYSERSILSRLDEERPTRRGRSDYDRVMGNLETMPEYRRRYPPPSSEATRSKTNKRVQSRVSNKTYVKDPMLNELLNQTSALSSDEMYDRTNDLGSIMSFGNTEPQYETPWDEFDGESVVAPPAIESRPAVTVKKPFKPIDTGAIPTQMTGMDGKPINMTDETVQNVLDVLANTDFRAKFKKIEEAGNRFREMNVAPPRYDSKQFNPIE